MSRYTSEYGQRLRCARTAAGMTQVELADQLGMTRSSVANVEAGRQAATAEQVIQHADAIGIDPHWLLTGRGPDQAATVAAWSGVVKRMPALSAQLRTAADNLARWSASMNERKRQS